MTLSNCTVAHTLVEVARNWVGDEVLTTVTTTWEWALLAPRDSGENANSQTPDVIDRATLYGPPGIIVGARDTLAVSGHSPAMDGTWEVDGHAAGWSLGDWHPGVEVAIKRPD